MHAVWNVVKVQVVSQDVEWCLEALEIVMPYLDAVDDCKELLLADAIVQLSWGQATGHEGDRVEPIVVVLLGQDA